METGVKQSWAVEMERPAGGDPLSATEVDNWVVSIAALGGLRSGGCGGGDVVG